jgi:glucose dehydrogenase
MGDARQSYSPLKQINASNVKRLVPISAHRSEEMGGSADRPARFCRHVGDRWGLVFTAKLTGQFVALDAATGKTLWQFQTGSSINSTAITYTHNGRQYVTIASGRRGVLANRYAATKVPSGGSVWTFALMP